MSTKTTIKKKNNQHEADKMFNVLSSILDNMDAFVYVSDMENHEILFVNRMMREVFNIDYDTTGCICYEVIQENTTERCSFCPINKLEKDPTPFVWDAFNSRTGHTYRCLDSVIEWTNKQKVHMQFAVDVTDTRRMQEDADNMLAVLKNILNNLNDNIYVSDMDTDEILFTNKKMLEEFDLTEGDAIGEICWKVFQDGFTERCSFCPEEKLSKNINTPIVWDEHNTVTDRNYKNVDTAIEWIDGKKVHLQHSTDVTDILNAQQEVKDANRRLEVALDASGAGVWEIDFVKNLYTYDERCAKLLVFDDKAGSSSVEKIMEYLEKVMIDADPEIVAGLKSKELYTEWPTQDIKLYLNDGDIRYVRIFGNPLRDKTGKILSIVGMNIDITDSVNMENELKAARQAAEDKGRVEADERSQIMLDATPLAASFWDRDGKMLDCNMECVRLFGLSRKEEYIDHFYDLNPEYQPDGMRTDEKAAKEIAAAFETGYRKFEWMYLTVDGSPLPVETTLVRVSMRDEYRLAAYSRDLRDIKASEKARLEATEHSMDMELQAKLAIAASEAKSQFLSNMSHEIRTPMNAVIGMATLLSEEKLNEKQSKYVNNVLVSATSLMGIINDILDLSKIEAQKLALVMSDFDLHKFLENIEEIFSFSAKNKGISFEMQLDCNLPRNICGDDIRLRQILINILGNAIKFTEKGKVLLAVKREDERLFFRIEDTGIGMKKEDIPRIFNEFDQLNAGNNSSIRGTGLGLSISKNLIELMGGSVCVNSEYKVGSVFDFDIPFIPGNEANLDNSKTMDDLLISAPNAEVLVVDDNEINLNVVSAMLKLYKIKCDTAISGPKAIKMISQKNYDIVFMDQMMPEMDGVEVTKNLRESYREDELIIIALTANAIEGAKEMLLNVGMNDYLSKPIDRKPLLKILKKWLPEDKVCQLDQINE